MLLSIIISLTVSPFYGSRRISKCFYFGAYNNNKKLNACFRLLFACLGCIKSGIAIH